MKRHSRRWIAWFAALIVWVCTPCWAIEADDLIRMKEAGISEQTIRLYLQIELQRAKCRGTESIGQHEIKGEKGKGKVIRFIHQRPEVGGISKGQKRGGEEENPGSHPAFIIDTRRQAGGGGR